MPWLTLVLPLPMTEHLKNTLDPFVFRAQVRASPWQAGYPAPSRIGVQTEWAGVS